MAGDSNDGTVKAAWIGLLAAVLAALIGLCAALLGGGSGNNIGGDGNICSDSAKCSNRHGGSTTPPPAESRKP
ncbi:hypothetical protein [Streptomyces sp. NPDC090057]|uniref:hypothetical protein n=1 Tax=Streptomyces sp. NPDC090057 TaxID=3365935 RepID=UPI0037FCAF7F